MVKPMSLRRRTKDETKEMPRSAKYKVNDKILRDLAKTAFFFAMHSCEYTTPPKERLAKRTTLGNMTFRMTRKIS
jgi:hypothetical protein